MMDSEEQEDIIICVPGQRLCIANQVRLAGLGTYEEQGYIYSKLAGVVQLTDEKVSFVSYVLLLLTILYIYIYIYKWNKCFFFNPCCRLTQLLCVV
ncbi:hypothetical protein DMN91_002006 [Ooceraea biroi]|uniref:Exosome complex component N-terminal domain-containing protein n=1 Tax=Ooceraea biroi TaxID=2015173 RepID=A0A3L8E0E0_OOCBI|nr:hypothetical protein DMN91_002006 [Ooceraea biroi]